MFGIDPRKTIRSLRGLPSYLRDLNTLRTQAHSSGRTFPLGKPFPCLDERFSESGSAKGHYFHQDLLVARRIYANRPAVHVDVGSRVDGFVAHVASFRQIDVFYIRPLPNNIPNIRFVQADLMTPLSAELGDYADSLSCLHALEHFGLGRYGDPVNYDGHLLGLSNLRSILRKGGKLYLSVPIGAQCIEFNAHRIFSMHYLLECFADQYHIDRFSLVDDKGNLHEDISITSAAARDNFGCRYGCGIFEMTKL